jgi:hypothetical protein
MIPNALPGQNSTTLYAVTCLTEGNGRIALQIWFSIWFRPIAYLNSSAHIPGEFESMKDRVYDHLRESATGITGSVLALARGRVADCLVGLKPFGKLVYWLIGRKRCS